jgi:hypothetical protein
MPNVKGMLANHYRKLNLGDYDKLRDWTRVLDLVGF